MKNRDKNDLEDFEIPEQLYYNLMPDEKILYQFKSVKPSIIDKILLLMILGIIILEVFVIISSMLKGILFSPIPMLMWCFAIPLMIVWILFLSKFNSSTIEYYVIITNMKIYTFKNQYKEENLDIIELNSIKLIAFRKRKQSEKYGDVGIINIFSDTIKPEKNHKISIKGVQDLLITLNIIKSIIYHYGNIKERLDTIDNERIFSITHEFKLDMDLWEKTSKSLKRATIISLFSLIALIIGLIGFIYTIIYDLMRYNLIFVLFLSFGFPFLFFNSMRKHILSKILSTKKSNVLRLKDKELILLEKESSLSFRFNLNLYINIYNTYYSSKKRQIKNIGGVSVKNLDEDLGEVCFGPLFEFLDLGECVFLHLLYWKGQMGYLKTKEQILKSFKEVKDKDQIESDPITREEEGMSNESYDQSNEIIKPFLHLLNPNERILLFFKPKIKLTISIFIIIIGLLCTIITISIIIADLIFPSFVLNTLITFLAMIGAMFGIVSICLLPGNLMMKKSMFLFTDQKIIAKYAKKYLVTSYDNISSIIKKDKKKAYNIDIFFKTEIKGSQWANNKVLYIQKVPKGNDLIIKIKKIRDSVLINK